MNGLVLVLSGVVVAVAAFFVKLVLEREYWWIARRIGGLVIRVSGLLLPRRERKLRVAEWLGELDEAAAAEEAAIAFAIGTVVAATAARTRGMVQVLRKAAAQLKTSARESGRAASPGTIGPIELRLRARNYGRVLEDALREGWTVSRTSDTGHIVLTRTGDDEPRIVLLDREGDDPTE